MAQEVGVAYVTLLPSGKGFSKAVEGQVDQAVASAERKGSGLFSRLGAVAKGVVAVTAGAVTALGAIALGGGISRVLNIEDAQAKLKGLGHDTQAVETIMKDALAAVKGTAFGLDSAATVAASAVAAGIKPGQELEKYLKLTADAATIAGVSLDEMGSILNKTTATGKVYTENLNQLAERGIPIFQWLADEYGVTQEALSEMVAKGEVDAATFRKVIEENIGGAALASGSTTRGAFANMMASLSRFGAALAGPFLGAARDFFNEMILVFDGITSRLAPSFATLQWYIDGLDFNFSDRLLAGLDPVFNAINGFTSALQGGTLEEWFSGLAESSPGIGLLAAALEAVEPILPAIKDLFAEIGVELAHAAPAFADVLTEITPLIPALGELLVEALRLLVQVLPDLVPLLTEVLGAVAALAGSSELQGFLGWLGEIVSFLGTKTTDVFSDFADSIRELGPAFGGIADWFEGLAEVFSGETIFQILGNAQTAFGQLFTTITQPFTDAWTFISTIWAAITTFLSGVWAGIVAAATGAWSGLGETLGGILQIIYGLFTGNFDLIRQQVSGFLSTVSTWWNTTWSNVSSTIGGIWSGIVSSISVGIANAVATVQQLPGRIMAAISGAASWLFSVGQDIIRGLINGVGSMVNSAVQAVQNVGGAMLDGVKDFLGIASPSRRFRDEVGRMIGEGVISGVDLIRPQVVASVTDLVPVPDGSGASRSGAATYQFHMTPIRDNDPVTTATIIGREFARRAAG